MNPYAATPRVSGGCCCKPPVADSFSPGTTAVMGPLAGMGDSNYREVRADGLPPILRMGTLAGFLGQDDGLDLVGMDTGSFVDEPVSFLPQIENSSSFFNSPFTGVDPSLLDFSSSPTGSLRIPAPVSMARIPSNVAPTVSQPGTSVAASTINAATAAFKAATGASPTSTLTPAQVAAMQKSAQLNLGTSQWFAGITNQDVLMLGAAAALFVVLVAGKK